MREEFLWQQLTNTDGQVDLKETMTASSEELQENSPQNKGHHL